MRTPASKGLRPLLAVLLLGLSAAAPEVAAIEIRDNLFLVDCVVQGVAERCQLDTGDNAVATLRPIPAFRTLPVLKTMRAMGVAGVVVPSAVVHLDRLSAGGLTLRDLDDVQLHDGPLPYSTLGLGFFERLGAVTFDFRTAQLRRAGPVPERVCPGAVSTGNPMRIPIALAGQTMQAGWDTGASSTVADARFVAAHPELFAFVRELASGADSTSAGIPARLFKARDIAICGHEFKDVTVVAVDMSAPKARIADFPDLVLGANLMAGHVWAFDFANHSWSLD